MSTSISDVLEFIEDNDVKFIRLAFCDIFGMQKNISILPNELMRAFSDGICFDASALAGFMKVESSDLLLFQTLQLFAFCHGVLQLVELYVFSVTFVTQMVVRLRAMADKC